MNNPTNPPQTPVTGARIGLVGTGLIASLHSAAYSLLPSYFPSPAVHPVKSVVSDIDLATAQAGARRLGWEHAVGSFEELVARDDVDIVDISTPNNLHAPIAIAAARAGKSIICEKPLSTDAAGARSMYEAARDAGIRTAVNFQKRRIPAIAYAHDLIQQGEIGELLFIHGSYRQHFGLLPLPEGAWRNSPKQLGSFLSEVGSHLIDLGRFLAGEYHSVVGLTDREATGRHGELESFIAWSATMGDGVLGSFDVGVKASSEGDGISFEVYGTKGAIRWHNSNSQVLQISRESNGEPDRGFTSVRMSAPHPFGQVFGLLSQEGLTDSKAFEAHEILEAFTSGASYHPDFEDGLRVAEVVEAVLRSAETGTRIELGEVR